MRPAKKLFVSLAVTILAIFGLSSLLSAETFLGVYQATKTWWSSGREYRIKYTLKVLDNNRVELYAENAGSRLNVDSDSVRKAGEIIYYLENRSRVLHEGRWDINDSRLILYMERLDGRYARDTYRASLYGNMLTLYRFDTKLYGSDQIRFSSIERARSSSKTAKIVAGAVIVGGILYYLNKKKHEDDRDMRTEDFAGDYQATRSEFVNDRYYDIRYTLSLNRSGTACLTTEAIYRIPPITNTSLREFGEIIYYLRDDRVAQHEGTWSPRKNEVNVNLSYLNGHRKTATLTFRYQNGTLFLNYDNSGLYGRMFSDFKKSERYKYQYRTPAYNN